MTDLFTPISSLICSAALAVVMPAAGPINKAYDQKLLHDYTARGYFISVEASQYIDSHTSGVVGPFRAGWSADPDQLEYPQASLKYFHQLNRALDRLPVYGVAGKTEIYRGIYSTNTVDTPERRYFKGKVWIERRFQSSTSSLKVAEQFAAGAYKNEGCGGCTSGNE